VVLVAVVQQPQTFEQASPDDTFRDVLDVAVVAVPLALVVLLVAVTWPGIKRWARHRMRRRRRRRHHDAHPGAPTTP
jgi:peptidoglycan/LPS O-acetylase OafA/YrhL